MVVKVFNSADEIGKAAAAVFAAQVITKPDSILGLATGSSPVPTYNNMISLYKEGVVDFKDVTTFNLDEYVGLEKNHEQSYWTFMHENLFNSLNIPEDQINVLSGVAADLEKECNDYEEKIRLAGGIDLQILGIGNNGHIAFNEPDNSFSMGTHKVALTESTIEANTRFFESREDVPRFAVSMGVGSIFKAKKIILIATGAAKANAVNAMVNGPVDPNCPASILQLHNDVTIFCDDAAAGLLK